MAITVKTKAEVSDTIKKSLDRAKKAMDVNNHGYACQILQDILHASPGFNEARLLLRQAQLEQINYSVSWPRRIIAFLTTAIPVYIQGPSQLRKGNHGKALEIAEKAMQADPTLVSTLMFLRRAAKEAELPEIAVNAMETAIRFNPKSIAAHRALGEDYQEVGQAQKAVQILQKVCELQPNNPNAINELKAATATAAMEKGRWEEAESYKDVMKDEDKAQELEQEERLVIRDPEARKKQIEKTRAKIEQEPSSIGHYKRLASLLQQDHAFEEAIEAYNKVMELSGTYDPGIDEQISECISSQYNQLIKQAREAGETEEKINELARERDEALLERLQKRVENFPNELNFRFELGVIYWQLGQVDAALQQFQQTQRASHLARSSHIYMGKCFRRKELYDMSIEQFEQAAADKDRVPAEEYKDILYESGLAYEQKGDADNAFKKFKELYSMDVRFRDIEERIQKYYKQQ